MPYDERQVAPMRMELTRVGFKELKTAGEVELAIQGQKGTTLVVVNSVCGCAAGMARPGVAMSLNNKNLPDHLTTVFAGQDLEAVAKVRNLVGNIPPSSPSVALFRDAKLVWFLPRHEIEGRSAMDVANRLAEAYEKFCTAETVA
jgi:putative YphP/YqiW family bacilliredoxin